MSKQVEQQKEAIAAKIKLLRSEQGISYERFATDNGLDRKQYWRIEENQTNMTLNSLLRILAIHQMSLEDFFKGL